jgi:hypothetical protein
MSADVKYAVKYPMTEVRGLQLGASCCNRHIDWCPRDIDRAHDVSVHR